MPTTDTDLRLPATAAEIQCYKKLTDYSGESLIGRLSRVSDLSANKEYGVDQFSVKMLWPTPDTANATLYVRLKEKDDKVSSSHSSQVSAML